jgi:hypothetical protein
MAARRPGGEARWPRAPQRRQALRQGLAGGLVLALPLLSAPSLAAARSAPFRRLAVLDPPFVEEYEVLVAVAPTIGRGNAARAVSRIVSEADSQLKTTRITAALDPARTRLHEHFVHALADALDEADVKVLLVPMEAADNEAALVRQVQQQAPQADGLMLANVMGRFVALHGLDSYAPGVMVGIKARPLRADKAWLEQVFSAGFRGIDPRAEHLEVVDMPERFDNVDGLMAQVDLARQALIAGVEAIAAEVAKRLMA